MSRFHDAIAAIDAANAEDPNRVLAGGIERPAELVYGERMSEMLERLDPAAPEALQLAVRAQHLCRWKVPRNAYPMDRAGYHRWRNDLKRRHAEWAGEILARAGYGAAEIARVAALIRKEGLTRDAEAQALEDTACLVFLAHYAADFAAKHEPEKVEAILIKTLSKMSGRGRAAIASLDLAGPVRELVERAGTSQREKGDRA